MYLTVFISAMTELCFAWLLFAKVIFQEVSLPRKLAAMKYCM